VKPELKRPCPLCGGAMKWCGDVPIVDDDPKFAMETHDCSQITCTACKYNVDFNGPEMYAEEDMDKLHDLVSAKWNGAAGVPEGAK